MTYHPLLAYCDNTGEPLAWMLRRGSAGSNTAADHLVLLDAAITALPPAFRRRLMVTADGAGASHGLIARLDELAARRGYELTYSVGWVLGERERAALRLVPGPAWQIAIDSRGEVRERRAGEACAVPVGASTSQVAVETGITVTAARTASRDIRRHKAPDYG
jgi:hypothetical protein